MTAITAPCRDHRSPTGGSHRRDRGPADRDALAPAAVVIPAIVRQLRAEPQSQIPLPKEVSTWEQCTFTSS
ncbi:MAG: hypothetical protein M3198_15285 [Actinomycetota bacterium]|nr:hypothetical protein [Actinomycetota bacterium]